MSQDDARPVPADRSGVDPIPIPREADEAPDQGWIPGLDYVNPDGTVARVPVNLAGTVYDPDAQLAPEPVRQPPPPPPPPRGGEMRRVLHKGPPGVIVGGQAKRPVLQNLPKGVPAERVDDLNARELRRFWPDQDTRRILGWIRLAALVGVGFVTLMVWLALRNGVKW